MNFLYLEVGGSYSDILTMNYWRFLGVMKTLAKRNAIKSGKPWIERGLPRSSKDMIKKRKAQR